MNQFKKADKRTDKQRVAKHNRLGIQVCQEKKGKKHLIVTNKNITPTFAMLFFYLYPVFNFQNISLNKFHIFIARFNEILLAGYTRRNLVYPKYISKINFSLFK